MPRLMERHLLGGVELLPMSNTEHNLLQTANAQLRVPFFFFFFFLLPCTTNIL